jgi:YihY family inner membrane protein
VASPGPEAGGARPVWKDVGRAAQEGIVGFYRSDNLTYAASIAYYALLSLFPFLLLVLTILARATEDIDNKNAVLSFVLRYFPTQFDFITGQIDSFGAGRLTIGVAGTIGLIWGALGVFGAISTAVNYAWGVTQTRGFWRHKLFSFLMLAVAAVFFLAALLLVSASHLVGASWFAGVLARFPGLGILRSIGVRYGTALLLVAIVGFLYYFVPYTKVRLRDVWPGAVLTGFLWKEAFEVFSWFVGDMTRMTRVNGSITAVIVFLLWVYVQAVILLYGAEFTAAYAFLRTRSPAD